MSIQTNSACKDLLNESEVVLEVMQISILAAAVMSDVVAVTPQA